MESIEAILPNGQFQMAIFDAETDEVGRVQRAKYVSALSAGDWSSLRGAELKRLKPPEVTSAEWLTLNLPKSGNVQIVGKGKIEIVYKE